MSLPPNGESAPDAPDGPPIGRSWELLYALVLAWQVVLVVLFIIVSGVYR